MIRAIGLFRAQQAQRIATERDAEGRVWCQLFPLGTWHRADFPGGKMELTRELLADFIASWKAGGSPPLPVDFNHDEEGPAAGWIEDLRIAPTGELEGAVKWNERAAAEIKADEKRYLSPTWSMQHVNRRTGEKGGPWLYGAALLNDPFYDSMPRVAASASAETAHPSQHPTQEQHMNEEQLKTLRAKLGLASDATIDAILEAAGKKHVASNDGEKLTAAIRTAVEPLELKLKAAQEESAKLQAERRAEQVASLIEAGKREGKALDGLKDFIASAAEKSLDEAKKLIAAVPATVPVVARGVPGNSGEPRDAVKKAQAELDVLVLEKMKAGLSFRDATRAAGRERKDLADLAYSVPSNHADTAQN